MKLPIELIPNTTPPRFKWYQILPSGVSVKEIGVVSPSLEVALVKLIQLTMSQENEIAKLKKQLEATKPPTPQSTLPIPAQPQPKKNKDGTIK